MVIMKYSKKCIRSNGSIGPIVEPRRKSMPAALVIVESGLSIYDGGVLDRGEYSHDRGAEPRII